MRDGDAAITDFCNETDPDAVLEFLAAWVTGSRPAAEQYLADHADGQGTTLIARVNREIAGLVTLRWTSNNPAFAEHGIPLVHELIVVPRFRRMRLGTSLMDAAEQLVARRGRQAVGITVGLFDQYGPAQRLYIQRGYVPDGRGACRARTPLREGETVNIDHTLIIWLTKDITSSPASATPA